MKKVIVIGMSSIAGGVESFLLNYYKNIDRNCLQFDFLCLTEETVAYEEELKQMGAELFHVISKRKNPILQHEQLIAFFKVHASEYIAIWANLNSLANINFLQIAKKYGINRIIVHSHNSANMGGKVQLLLHNINKKKIDIIATDYWACSEKAAEWFFNANILPNSKIINNAIDVRKFLFDENKRMKYRKQLGWEEKVILGNVGRLHFQKNQAFIIKIFSELAKIDDGYRFVFIGEGEDQEFLTKLAKKLGVEEKIKFTGRQNDIAGWLSAFDLFFFPSVFEGLSIVTLEAQANGLPIVASDKAITSKGIVTDNVECISLESPNDIWVDCIIKCSHHERIDKQVIADRFKKKGFDIFSEANKLQNFFLSMKIQ